MKSERAKAHQQRSLYQRLIDEVSVFLWLCMKFAMDQITTQATSYAAHKNGSKSLGAHIDALAQKGVNAGPGIYDHDLMVGPFRFLSIIIVTDPSSFAKFYRIDQRPQFKLASILMDMRGNNSFLHQPLNIHNFMADKNFFKQALLHGHTDLIENVKKHFEADLDNTEQWKVHPVSIIMRRLVFKVLSETYMGLTADIIMAEFGALTQLIDRFNSMWQNPERLRPREMKSILLQLDVISNRLHENRGAAPLLDYFYKQYGRSFNIAAIFFVAANLTQTLNHAVIKVGSNTLAHQDKIKKELTLKEQIDDIARLVITDRFRDSRVFRIISNPFFAPRERLSWHKLLAQHHLIPPVTSFNGEALQARQIILIPQGLIHRKRINDGDVFDEEGRVKPHYVFAEGRSCPGGPSVEIILKTILATIWRRKCRYTPDSEALAAYNDAIENCHKTGSNGRSNAIPEVHGVWQAIEIDKNIDATQSVFSRLSSGL